MLMDSQFVLFVIIEIHTVGLSVERAGRSLSCFTQNVVKRRRKPRMYSVVDGYQHRKGE